MAAPSHEEIHDFDPDYGDAPSGRLSRLLPATALASERIYV
jgi:hypothetical protein